MTRFSSNRMLSLAMLGLPRHRLTAGILFCVGVLSGVASGAVQDDRSVPAIIFDSDVDFDDTVVLAALAQQHLRGVIDLRAVTVTNNGAGLPGKAYRHARCLLDSLGLPFIPVADATYSLPHAFPDNLRFAFDFILDASIPDCPAGQVPAAKSASDLLVGTVRSARGPVTLIATGPLTNVALALQILSRNGAVPASAITHAYVEGGAVRVPGGLEGVPGFDNTQNLNIWGDPAAAQTVFTSLNAGVLHLVGGDATRFVPVRLAYVATLTAEARTAAAQYVATLMNHPILQGAIQAGLPVFWWDPLAALSAIQKDLVEFSRARITVVQAGVSSGRTIEDPAGAPMWVAFSADQTRFEDALMRVLNGVAGDR
jgi:purine nucleosidase